MDYFTFKIFHLINFFLLAYIQKSSAQNSPLCSPIPGVFPTVDFKAKDDPKVFLGYLGYLKDKLNHTGGPFVNSEFYSGWINRWEMPPEHVDSKLFSDALDVLLSMNASVNIYPFCGGTLFGFMAGGTHANKTDFHPVTTSYDFDGPLTEAGDPTDKYFAVRNVIGKYLPLPSLPLPTVSQKMELPAITLKPVSTIFDEQFLGEPIVSETPQTFAQLKLGHGFVLYSTTVINPSEAYPEALTVRGLSDRAWVFVDKEYHGTLSRTHGSFQLMIKFANNSRLDILVENQGRYAFEDISQPKGIVESVSFVRPAYDIELKNWRQHLFFKNWPKTVARLENQTVSSEGLKFRSNIPAFFSGSFQLPNRTDVPLDTFLRLDGWGKGVAFLNGFNLGRYWPLAGPQVTLYAPSNLFRPYPQLNVLTVFELERNPCAAELSLCVVKFVKEHELNGPVAQDFGY